MGLKSFIESKGITAQHLVITSRRLEAIDETGRDLLIKRAAKRRDKELAPKKYAELNIGKPATSGRGISPQTVELALADKPLARKARAKVFRAVNAILTKKGQPAADMKAIFGEVAMKKGAAKKEEKKA
jgi:hypothetical protein